MTLGSGIRIPPESCPAIYVRLQRSTRLCTKVSHRPSRDREGEKSRFSQRPIEFFLVANLRNPASYNELVAFHLRTWSFIHLSQGSPQTTNFHPPPFKVSPCTGIARALTQGVKSQRDSLFRKSVPRNGATFCPWMAFKHPITDAPVPRYRS